MTMIDIQFNSKSETVELVYPNGEIEILASDFPSEPKKSSDNKKAVYISPSEWETRGNLYLVDLQKGDKGVLVASEEEYVPKNVIWKDDSRILVIIGYGYGTLAVGGNIFIVNIETKEKTRITNYEDKIQITDFYIEDGVLYYEGIRYKDDNYIESEVYSNNISLDSLLSY
ncbi:DUF4652 domain-containing protein [Salipaludibacillus sp. CF4.18]|uniref:DUF4652 domain-containing protein n=1 Tax=Salipaludibacillus sp. CF4.18 TaxID=3373081 RepID=UPI003EE7EA1C